MSIFLNSSLIQNRSPLVQNRSTFSSTPLLINPFRCFSFQPMKSNKLAPKKAHGHMITIRMNYLRGNSLCKLKIFPAEWKKANVVPVYKKRDHMLKTTD